MSKLPKSTCPLDTLKGKYGLEDGDEQATDHCKENSLICPKLVRYIGMGHYEIFAVATTDSDKFFIIPAGGSNGYDREANYQDMLKLTLDNTVTFDEIMKHVKGSFWTQIVDATHGDGVDVHSVVEYNGDEVENDTSDKIDSDTDFEDN
ncbi:Hypothetical protein HVR_LOCUS60 [uncultured virus]|nr:Hypothetical protein HVR_LOCUS60 [uncultured virus]